MNEGTLLAIVIPSATVLAGILINNHRISDLNGRSGDLHGRIGDLQRHMDQRFTGMEQLFDQKLQRVEQVVDARPHAYLISAENPLKQKKRRTANAREDCA